MPRTRSIVWSELKLGIVGVLAIVMATTLIVAVGGQGGLFAKRYRLKTKFEDIQGLKEGAVVRVNGKEVGKVTGIAFAGPEIDIGLQLSLDVQPLITTEATATIGSLGLLGEPVIDVKAVAGGVPHEYIKSGRMGKSMGELSDIASRGLDQVTALLADIREGRGTLGKFVRDDALYGDLQRFVTSATAVTQAMKEGQGTIGGLMRDPAAYQALRTSLENLQVATARLNSGTGALARLISDDKMGASLATTTTNLEQVTGRLSRGEGTAGKFLTDRQVYDQLNSLTQRVDRVILGLNEGRGTAGKLLQDQQLYDNMNRAVTELRDLLAEIRKDPKKYLRVSVSIF
jgi:phospholipid/cholesterol/gamma-HCH transport system substrate-binding protein